MSHRAGPCGSRPGLRGPRRWAVCLAFCVLGSSVAAAAAGPAPAQTNAPPPALTNLSAIPPAEIAAQAESALGVLRALGEESRSNATVSMVEEQLPPLAEEIGTRSEENARILAHSSSLELFSRLEGGWQDESHVLVEWNRALTRWGRQLQTSQANIEKTIKTWELTRDAETGGRVPPELSRQIDSVLGEAKQAHQAVQDALGRVLVLQSRVAEQDARAQQSLGAIEQAREQIIRHLFARDSPALWSAGLGAATSERLAVESQHSLTRQWKQLRVYLFRKRARVFIQLAALGALSVLLLGAQRKLRSLSLREPRLEQAAKNLNAPLASALLLTLLLSPWIYPHAPRALWSIAGSLALIPALIVLRGLLKPSAAGVLYALAAFFLIDQLRTLAAAQPLVWRCLFLAEMLAGCGYCALALRRMKAPDNALSSTLFRKVLGAWLRVGVVVFALVVVAEVLGYARLSSLAGNVLLSSAYLALVLYAVVRVIDQVLIVALALSPLAGLAMIKHHAEVIAAWVQKALEWVAVLLWLGYVVQKLALGHSVLAALKTTAALTITIGKRSFTLGHLFLFALILYASVLVSRFLRFVLQEEVYPHLRLAAGLHYSISTTLHYVVLLVGFLIALTMIGVDLTNLTIVAGAVGVGLGFGMQNIVNNFVSGIILLFERPVKVGDVIQLDSTEGVVKRIGIRASIVRTLNGSEIIVPNAKLISDPVTNWTFSQRRRLITVPIAVASDTDPQRVIALLKKIAAGHSLVSQDRPVQALLTNLNNGTANYEVRAWTDQSEDWQQVRSDLFTSIKSTLATESIALH